MAEGVRKRGKTWSYYFDGAKVEGERNKIEKGGFRIANIQNVQLHNCSYRFIILENSTFFNRSISNCS